MPKISSVHANKKFIKPGPEIEKAKWMKLASRKKNIPLVRLDF